MISKIDFNYLKPKFGLVTDKAANKAKNLMGNSEYYTKKIDELVEDSAKNAPNIKIFCDSSSFYFNMPYILNRSYRKSSYFSPKDKISVITAFKEICDNAKLSQKNLKK